MDIEKKFENFKKFVKDIARNPEVLAEYENMTWFKLQALAYVLLLPNRGRLDEIVPEMQEKIEFDDEHLSKFRRYIDLFVEYISGEAPSQPTVPEYITSQNMEFQERMRLYMEDEEEGGN
jgi:hypothetical protein